ncbi:hypothetical protein L486_06134 [Kwoniella mangroviensis CBS 10435]|uniref:Uncharacterized protein n=1 Tax=Kwoniella mangroviensis CBS 10435 TaxID=1331196 RepID=A0A1B9IL35_9TREE|nr:hypothetical protein L486_06134 [Kwoniella mangroviensis CBS 10435]
MISYSGGADPPPLPSPRRILTATDSQGQPVVLDDTTPFSNDNEELKAFVGYVQPDLIGKPDQAIKYSEYKPAKISHDDQVSLRWVDIPPKYKGDQHYTNTFVLPDGQSKIVKVGDTVVQAANIHAWNNNTDQWARFVGVVVPSESVKVNGKTLDQPPINGYHAQF